MHGRLVATIGWVSACACPERSRALEARVQADPDHAVPKPEAGTSPSAGESAASNPMRAQLPVPMRTQRRAPTRA